MINYKHLPLVMILGFSSGLPYALLTSTLQAWFASAGMSVMTTAALTLLGLPYLCRVLWTPLLDRYALFSLGRRRSWIILMQLMLLAGFLILAGCSPQQSLSFMVILAFILAACSATQDAAIDAHRIEYLPVAEHGLGAAIATFGYRLALVTTGGFALVLADYTGFNLTYLFMSFMLLPAMIMVLFSAEPAHYTVNKTRFLEPWQVLLNRPGGLTLLAFIIFYKLGAAFTATTSGIVIPFMIQGLGFSLAVIGYVNKVAGLSSLIIGGFLAGLLLMRWSLYRALVIFGLIQALANSLFIVLALVGKHLGLLIVAVIIDNFATGMTTTAIVVLFMRIVDKRYTATQFSLLAAVSAIPNIVAAPIAALLQKQIGWVGLYQLSCILALLFIPLLTRINKIYSLKNLNADNIKSKAMVNFK